MRETWPLRSSRATRPVAVGSERCGQNGDETKSSFRYFRPWRLGRHLLAVRTLLLRVHQVRPASSRKAIPTAAYAATPVIWFLRQSRPGHIRPSSSSATLWQEAGRLQPAGQLHQAYAGHGHGFSQRLPLRAGSLNRARHAHAANQHPPGHGRLLYLLNDRLTSHGSSGHVFKPLSPVSDEI